MKLSEYSISLLGNMIAGDIEGYPYRKGHEIVNFFNQFGARDVYGNGFGTRKIYAQDKIRSLNDTVMLREVISKLLDPREFSNSEKSINDALVLLNENFKHDGYEIVVEDSTYKVRELIPNKIKLQTEVKVADSMTQLTIDENIQKCHSKLKEDDFSGAITNARSLLEAVFIGIEKELGSSIQNYDGDFIKLYKRVQKLLSLEADRKDISGPLRQILAGLTSIVHGLAAMRNKMSDAHASTYRPNRHHAELAVGLCQRI